MTAQKATTASKARRAATVVALAAGAALALSGCGTGQVSQTAAQVAAVNGNNADVGKVALRDVRILLPQSEEYNNAKGGKALLAFSAINSGEFKSDTLVSVEAPELGSVQIDGKAEIKPQGTIVAGAPEAAEAAGHDDHGTPAPTTDDAPATPTQAPGDETADPAAEPLKIEITGLQNDVTAGLTYPVRFNFKENGTVLVNVPVDAGHDLERAVTDKSKSEEKGASTGGH
ncbi:hypothetical protein HLB23_26950 [Nocardia uniformis]|uniref:Lipoprotein LpqE n=1 Tax=Nocardia uniformis TaxID=53432 RepID=A0A849CAT1_9NOCA|nr:hypothetical protein [Nocardia uniformis]NNH73450.1 hypothetical protein [Nocardia uniformis]